MEYLRYKQKIRFLWNLEWKIILFIYDFFSSIFYTLHFCSQMSNISKMLDIFEFKVGALYKKMKMLDIFEFEYSDEIILIRRISNLWTFWDSSQTLNDFYSHKTFDREIF